MACPSWNHPDMKNLIDKLGKEDAYMAFIKNNEEIPSLDKARDLLNTTSISSPSSGQYVTPSFEPNHGLFQPSGHTAFTSAVAPTEAEKVAKQKVSEAVDRLQDLASKVRSVEDLKANGIIHTSFEIDGRPIKNYADADNLGLSNRPILKKLQGDVKDILDRFVTKDGYLRDTPLEEDVMAGNGKVYDAMEAALSKRLKKFPEGTRFIHDINIMSQAGAGKAAKLQLLAIKPDGKASIFIFPFVAGKEGGVIPYKNEPDLAERRKENMRGYMREIKGILSKEYGIDKFDEATSIPIYTQMAGKGDETRVVGISMDGIKSNAGIKIGLMPVSTLDTRTGDPTIDKLLDKLSALYEAKTAIRGENTNNTIRLISKTIQALQMKGGMNMVTRLANNTSYAVETEVKNYKKNFEDVDVKDLTPADLNKFANRLNKSFVELGLYKDVDLYFKDYEKQKGDELTKAEKKMIEELNRAAKRAKLALDDLKKVSSDFVEKISDFHGVEGILIPEAKITGIAGRFNTFDEAPTKATRVMYKMMSNARNLYYNEARIHLDRLNDIAKDLHPWIKANGAEKFLSMLKRKDSAGRYKNELIGQYKGEFYDKLSEMMSKTDTKEGIDNAKAWVKDNIDMDAYKARLKEYKLKEEKNLRAMFPEEDISEKMSQINSKYGVESNLLKEDFVKSFPHEKWCSEEYKTLRDVPENKPLMDVYNFAREINDIAASVGYIDQEKKRRFLPFLSKDLAEKLVLGGSYSFGNSFLDSLTVSDRDLNSTKINRISNEVIDVLPKYFTHDSGVDKLDSEGNKYKDYSYVSDDLLKNLGAYMGKVLEYRQYAKLESQLQLLSFVEKNKSYIPVDRFGRVVKDAEPVEGNIDNHKILQDFIQNQLYGQSYVRSEFTDSAGSNITPAWNRTADKVNKRLGFEFMPKQDEARHISLIKTLDTMKTYQQLKVLGINIGTSIYRFIGTNIGGFIRAGKYYSMPDFFKHEMKHGALQFTKSNAALHILLLKQFLPVDGQFLEEVNHLSLNKLTRESAADFMMSFVKKAHDYVQYVNFGAMMDNALLIDGKIYNAREYVRKSAEYAERYDMSPSERKEMESKFQDKVDELVEKHGLLNNAEEVDGKLVIKGLDLNSDTVTKFRSLVRHEGLRLSGNISRENESRIRMNVWTRQLLLFKNWLPGMMKTRFKGLSYVEGAQEYQWGRLRTMGAILSSGVVSGCRNLIDMSVGTERGVKKLEELYERKKEEFEKAKGTPFTMTKPEFYDMVRRNIQEEAKSVSAMLVLLGIAMGLGASLKQADDRDKGGLAYAHRIIDRSYEELNLYYNPVSAEALINGSLFPVMGLPMDIIKFMGSAKDDALGHILGDQEMIKKSHPSKYLLKNFPVLKEVPNYIAIFAPDVAKEMGINVGTKQIHH